MDAFAVSITNGAVAKKVTFRFAMAVAVTFGLFQAVMPMLGWLVGKAGESFISRIDHWVALVLLCYIGIQMILEALAANQETSKPFQKDLDFKMLITLAFATSIDALATGIILPSAVGASNVVLLLLSVCLIGLITFFLCQFGVFLGRQCGSFLSGKAELLGGAVLILMGFKILATHLWG